VFSRATSVLNRVSFMVCVAVVEYRRPLVCNSSPWACKSPARRYGYVGDGVKNVMDDGGGGRGGRPFVGTEKRSGRCRLPNDEAVGRSSGGPPAGVRFRLLDGARRSGGHWGQRWHRWCNGRRWRRRPGRRHRRAGVPIDERERLRLECRVRRRCYLPRGLRAERSALRWLCNGQHDRHPVPLVVRRLSLAPTGPSRIGGQSPLDLGDAELARDLAPRRSSNRPSRLLSA
jgi:hypothetical protein